MPTKSSECLPVPAETFSIEEAAQIILGSDEPKQLRWLLRRLRRNEFPGYKANRRWRMTSDDITVTIAKLRPTATIPDLPDMAGLTRTSRRRISA